MSSTPVSTSELRVLVANRGEIARRIIRTVNGLGETSIAVFADPDADSPMVNEATTSVRLGPAALEESYLSIEALLRAADRTAATHIHPGYGFMAERTDFAEAVTAAGLTWVGPSPHAVASMGSKIEARRVAEQADVPIIPGFNESQDPVQLRAAAETIGWPVLVKASAGGGGKGIRIANSADEFDAALDAARTESLRAFGDDDVIVERYITRPRHIEVQIIADRHGTVGELGTRECSVQRRYQKVLEEAPAPNLRPETSEGIRQAAVTLAETIGYDSVGTVEFIVDAETEEFFFLEMNTRIQVEHTVTEQITGVDLIALQLAVADGVTLDEALAAVRHAPVGASAIEVRINAEDAWHGHVPQTGTVEALEVPTGDHIRWDAAVIAGSEVSEHYDSMIGKLIVTADDRATTMRLLTNALDATTIDGLVTNLDFHRWLVRQSDVQLATVTTRFLDETPLPRSSPFAPTTAGSAWNDRTGWRLTPHRSALAFDSPSRDDRWQSSGGGGLATGTLRSPFPGLITEVHVAAGDEVTAGQTLITIEAMKMLHAIEAPGTGIVDSVHVEPNTQVAGNDQLITFADPTSSEGPS